MGKLVKVVDDLFHIAKRLKEIDGAYQLYFNRVAHRFEIHAKGAMQVALPFDKLDVRTLEYARKTRVERAQKIVDEIERNNAILERHNQQKTCDKIMAQVEGVL